MLKEKKKWAYDAEYSYITKQCVVEYSEKMDMSAEQHCMIKFCVHLKKIPSETTVLLKEAFGKGTLGDSTIPWWHNAFVDGRESVEFEPQGGALQAVVTATNINTVAVVIEEDWHLTIRPRSR